MTFARTSVLYAVSFFVLAFSSFVRTDVLGVENPYGEGRASKYTTMADKSSLLPLSSSSIESGGTRSLLMDNSNDSGIGAAWASTAFLRDRSLHLRSYQDRFYDESSQISAQFFIDAQTDRARVFKDILNPEWAKKHFGSFLTDPQVIAAMEELSFAQENIGFMLHAHHMYKRVGLSVDLPLHFGIAHPWLSKKTRDMSAGSGRESDTHVLNPADEDEMIKRVQKIHYAGGIGDLKVAVNVIQPLLGDRVIGTIGLEAIIPLQSAKVATRNLSFDPVADDFNPTIYTLPFDSEEAGKFAFRLLEYFKAIGTNPALGQKSLSLAAVSGIKILVHPSCSLHQSFQVQYNFPVKEYRFIHRYRSDERVASNLAVEPGEYLVSSSRGLIVTGAVGIRQKVLNNITFGLFGDVFWQNNENFRVVFTYDENRSRLLENYAEMGRAKQVAVRLSVEKKFDCYKFSCNDVRLMLDAGVAISSSGIGKLWHVGLQSSGSF